MVNRNAQGFCSVLLFLSLSFIITAQYAYAERKAKPKKQQSCFRTADKKKTYINSSYLMKLLNDKLDKYQDLEIFIGSCHSGQFIEEAQDPNHGLKGDWSMSTANVAEHVAREKIVGKDEEYKGKDGESHRGLEAQGILKKGKDCYIRGYNSQYVKKVGENKNSITNKDLHEEAENGIPKELAEDKKEPQDPQYASSGEVADNMTLHGGEKSNHAIIFASWYPETDAKTSSAIREESKGLYEGLIGCGYTDRSIDYCYGRNPNEQSGADRGATKQDFENALHDMATSLEHAEDPNKEKIYIAILAHGYYSKQEIYYDLTMPPQPRNGKVISGPGAVLPIPADPNLQRNLQEDALCEDPNDPNNKNFWSDDTDVRRTESPMLTFATSFESFTGSSDVNIFLNDIFFETLTFNNEPNGGEYIVEIPDSLLCQLFPQLESDPNIYVDFRLPSSADSFILATDDDFYLDPNYPHMSYGIGIMVGLSAFNTFFDGDLNYSGVENFEDYADTADDWYNCTLRGQSGCINNLPEGAIPAVLDSAPVIVDGNLTEWNDNVVIWQEIDQPYSGDACDVHQAVFALQFEPNVIYLAAKVYDTNHHFTSSYSGPNTADCLDIFSQAGNSDNYGVDSNLAQHYRIGCDGSGGTWATLISDGTMQPEDLTCTARLDAADANWIYYEARVTPFLVRPSEKASLQQGFTLGFDVIVGTKYGHSGDFAQLSQNLDMDKQNKPDLFSDYKIAGDADCGGWGFLNGDINSDCSINLDDIDCLSSDWLCEYTGNNTNPYIATQPEPSIMSVDVPLDVEFSWALGIDAISHDVYLGTDYDDVADAEPNGICHQGRISDPAFTPDTLEAETKYYWRIDEVGQSQIWKGDIWVFTTASD